MNKTYRQFIVLTLMATFPLSAVAQTTTSPIFVKPIAIQGNEESLESQQQSIIAVRNEIESINQEIINKRISNQQEEKSIQALIEQNKILATTVEHKQQKVANDMHMFSDHEQFDQLRRVLNNYDEQITLRDDLLKKQDAEIMHLRAALDDMKGMANKGQELESVKQKLDEVTKQYNAAIQRPIEAPNVVVNANKGLLDAQNTLIAEKSRQVEELKDKLAKAQEELANTKEASSHALKEPVIASSVVVNGNKQALEEQDALLVEKSRQVEALKEELVTVKKELADALARANQVVKEPAVALPSVVVNGNKELLDEQKALLEEKSNQLQEFKQVLAKTKEELSEANKKYDAIIKEFEAKLNSNQSEANSKQDDLAKKLQDQVAAAAQLKDELKARNNVLMEIKNSLKEKDDQFSKLQGEAADKDKMISLLKEQLVKAQQDIDSAKQETSGLKSELAKDDAAFAKIRERGIVLKSKLKEQEEGLTTKDEFIAEYKSQLAKAKEQVENLKNKKNMISRKWHAHFMHVRKSVEEKTEQVDGLTKQLAESQEQLSKAESEIASLKVKIGELDQNAQGQIALSKDASLEIAALKLKLTDLQQKMQEQEVVLTKASENEANALKLKLSDLSVVRERMLLWQELSAKRSQRIALLEEKSFILASQSSRSNQNIKDYVEKIQSLQKSLEQKEHDLVLANKSVEEKIAAKEDVYRILDQFKARLKESSDVNNEQSKTIEKYRAQIEQLEKDAHKSQDEVQAKQEEINFLSQDLNQFKEKTRTALQQAQVKDLSVTMLQSTLDEKTKVHEVLVEQLKDQVKSNSDELAHVKEQLTVAETKLKQTTDEDKSQIARIQDMLKASREEIIVLNALVKEKDKQITDLKKGLDVGSKDFTRQNKDLEALQAELEQQKINIKKYTDDLQWKDKQIARLKIQMNDKNTLVVPRVMASNESAQVAALTAQLKEADQKLQEALRKSDYRQLRDALNDAKEQIAALKEKLRQKQQKSLENDPGYIEMANQLKSTKEALAQTIESYNKCQTKLDHMPKAGIK